MSEQSGIKNPWRPMTRAEPLDPEITEIICRRIMTGETVASILRDPGMPSKSTFYERAAFDDNFRAAIARAREAAQDANVDEMQDIADSATEEDYNAAKLRIWARQWVAAKRNPKVYGERSSVDVKVEISLTDLVSESMNHAKLAGDHAKVIEHDAEPQNVKDGEHK